MILQPLFENAIKYAPGPSNKKITITLKATCTNTNLLLTVHDNGVGIPEATIQEIHSSLSNEGFFSTKHIGLYNVNRKIILHCGKDYGLKIKSKQNLFTKNLFYFQQKVPFRTFLCGETANPAGRKPPVRADVNR